MKTEHYKQEFQKAVFQTIAENYLVPFELNLFVNHNLYRNNTTYEIIYTAILKLYGESDNSIDLNNVKGQCLSFHRQISEIIKDTLQINSILTIGYVNFNGQDFYKFEKINNNLFRVQADKREVVDIHVWLTLPSYEIIDVTFLAHITYVNSTPEMKEKLKKATDFPYYFGSANFLYLNELISYHPKYVGEDILKKNGFIRQAT